MFRVVRALWFFSALGSLATLLYIFASLPDPVRYGVNGMTEVVSRDAFFYIVLGIVAISNTIIYALAKRLEKRKGINEKLMNSLGAVSYAFGLAFNIFFVVSMHFISLFNSGENFNYDNFGYLLYPSIGLIILVVLALPYVLLRRNAVS